MATILQSIDVDYCSETYKDLISSIREGRKWLMSQLNHLLSPASGLLATAYFVASLFKYSVNYMTRGVQLGFATILSFLLPCTVRHLQVKNIRHCALQAPGH